MKQTPTPSQFRQDARLRIVTAFFRYLDESRVTETFASDLYDKVTDQIELLHHQGVEEALENAIKVIDNVELDGQHKEVWKYHDLVIRKLKMLVSSRGKYSREVGK